MQKIAPLVDPEEPVLREEGAGLVLGTRVMQKEEEAEPLQVVLEAKRLTQKEGEEEQLQVLRARRVMQAEQLQVLGERRLPQKEGEAEQLQVLGVRRVMQQEGEHLIS